MTVNQKKSGRPISFDRWHPQFKQLFGNDSEASNVLKSAHGLERVGDKGYLSSLLDGAPDDPRGVEHLVKIVVDKSRRRRTLAAAETLITRSNNHFGFR